MSEFSKSRGLDDMPPYEPTELDRAVRRRAWRDLIARHLGDVTEEEELACLAMLEEATSAAPTPAAHQPAPLFNRATYAVLGESERQPETKVGRARVPGDGPKCRCGRPAVWSGYCQMADGRGYCSNR